MRLELKITGTVATVLAAVLCCIFGADAASTQCASFTDPRSGEIYRTVVVGSQTWFVENLRSDTGDESRCLEDIQSNCERYGRLYTWSAAEPPCPAGWRLSPVEDW
jgi:hypothetical protein